MREYGRVIIIRANCPFVDPQWEGEVEGVPNLPNVAPSKAEIVGAVYHRHRLH